MYLIFKCWFLSIQNNVHIKDLAVTVRINEDNRISGINILSAYDGTSFYEDYNVSNIVSKVNLNSAGSYIIYNVDVYNLGNVLMEIKNINIKIWLFKLMIWIEFLCLYIQIPSNLLLY